MPELVVFADTNILLHSEPMFDQLPWPEALGVERVLLVVPLIVVSELDKHKRDPNQRRSARAKKVLRRIEEATGGARECQLGSNTRLQLSSRSPAQRTLDEQGLSRAEADDILLASVVDFQESNPGREAVLVTFDVGAKLRAEGHGLTVHALDEKWELKAEPDPRDKELRELTARLARAEQRIPKLRLCFEDGSNHLGHVLDLVPEAPADALERRMAEIRAEYPPMGRSRAAPAPGASGSRPAIGALAAIQSQLDAWSQVSPDRIAEYNGELEEFYRRCEDYYRDADRVRAIQCLTVRIGTVLRNEGTCPATGLDVFFHFPDEFQPLRERDRPVVDEPPQPPARPLTFADSLASGTFVPTFPVPLPSAIPRASQPPANVSGPTIRRANSWEVRVTVQKLKHHMVAELEPVYVVFPSFEAAQSFTIPYVINAENAPDEVAGNLHVVVERQS